MMLVLTYDVSLIDPLGKKRLRHVAKACERYGVRVQNSVFELLIDSGQLATLRACLLGIIDAEHDSIRIYRLGNQYANRIEILGRPPLFEQDQTVIL